VAPHDGQHSPTNLHSEPSSELAVRDDKDVPNSIFGDCLMCNECKRIAESIERAILKATDINMESLRTKRHATESPSKQ